MKGVIFTCVVGVVCASHARAAQYPVNYTYFRSKFFLESVTVF